MLLKNQVHVYDKHIQGLICMDSGSDTEKGQAGLILPLISLKYIIFSLVVQTMVGPTENEPEATLT